MLYRKTGFLNNAPQSTSTIVDWSQRKVAKVADVLRMEYMSSDESEVDEETRRVKRYVVRSFSWESRELKRAKKKLDRSHQDSLPGLSKRVFIPREQLSRLGLWSQESPSKYG
jgi:hypothetical protein